MFGWWRGLHFTTILRRRLAILSRAANRESRLAEPSTRTVALLKVGPAASDTDVLPLPLIAGYLDRYGVRVDHIRITSRNNASGEQETWVGLTVSVLLSRSSLSLSAA